MPFLMMNSQLRHKLTNVKTTRINKLLIAFVHRITLPKHLYSATVYAKFVFSIVPQLDYVVQFFLLFPVMYSKSRHKLVNVKIARINKCYLLSLHILFKIRLENLQCANINIQQAFAQNLTSQLFRNSTIWCSIACPF